MSQTQKRSILVIAEKPEFSFTSAQVLRQQGFSVMRASTLTEAQLFFGTENPSLILIDVSHDDDFGRVQRFRDNPLYSDIPIIAMTRPWMLSPDCEAGSFQFDSFQKPFVPSEFLSFVTARIR